MERLESIPLKRKSYEAQRSWDLKVVTEYFINNKSLSEVMSKFDIRSPQTVYNARNRVNDLLVKNKLRKD